MAADGGRDMRTLQPIALPSPRGRFDGTSRSGRLGVTVLMIGIGVTIGWIGVLGLGLIRLASLTLGLS
jgi:hypothetical protein